MQSTIRRKRFLVLKLEGLKFVEEWYVVAEPVPANVTKLYQLLLHMVMMKGTIPLYLASELGYASELIEQATSKGYVELSHVLKSPSRKVSRQIDQIIGIPPPEMSIWVRARARADVNLFPQTSNQKW